MGPRYLSFALALVALALTPGAQAAIGSSPEQELHRAAVRSERTAAFLAAWQVAGAEDRAAARDLLAAGARSGSPVEARPRLEVLTSATRALRGEAPPPGAEELQAFADSLDLQVRPGAFQAVAPGPSSGDDPSASKGEPLTVRVYRLWHLPRAPDVELSLVWIAPDGTRSHARREPFAGGAFLRRGFDMYVRAPLAEPGVWQLEPVVRAGDLEVTGAAVPVACTRLPSAEGDQGEPGDLGARVRPALHELLHRGLRRPDTLGVLRHLGQGATAATWDVLDREGAPWISGGFVDARRAGALVLLWTGGEHEDLPLLGPGYAAWSDVARRHGMGLFLLAVTSADAGALREGLAEIAQLAGRDPILVVRGPSLSAATLMLAAQPRGELPLGGLVLQASRSGVPKLLPDVPTLAVLGADAAASTAATAVTIVRGGSDLGLADELALPGHVDAWLQRND